jgi:hypothetical protein
MTETAKHEERDVNVRRLLQLGAGLGGTVVLSLLAMGLLFRFYDTHESRGPALSPLVVRPDIPPKPRLQVYEHVDLERKLQGDQKMLNSYGWVDRKSGTVRIPIDRAMQLLAERGLPSRGESK